jgi:DNA-directed RNA polymerase
MQNLIAVQEQIEQESRDLGVKRYQQLLETNGDASMSPGIRMLREVVTKLSTEIEAFTTEAPDARPAGRGAAVVRDFLKQFDSKVVAYVVGKATINAMRTQVSLQMCALQIASVLEDSVNHDELRLKEPRLHAQLMKKIRNSRDHRHRHLVLLAQQKFAGIRTIKWEVADKLRTGSMLIHMMAKSTGLLTIDQPANRKQTPYVLVPTPETMAWLDEAHARCALLEPVYLPMVVPPREWTTPSRGGYLTKHCRLRLIKTGNPNYLEELHAVEMPAVYRSINAIQSTPWRINNGVLALLVEVWEGGGMLGGLPPREQMPLPAKTFAEDAAADDPKLKAWKMEAAQVYEENARLTSKRVALATQITVAEKFSEFDRIYFPHTMDWRGRIYPVPAGLNPQGDDVAKALIQFSEGRPLGDNGAYWLAVHGANCAGVDKVSFTDRVQWVQEHEEQILESALNPLDGSRFWATMDSPWCFLAFCREWSALIMWHRSGKPMADFVSHLSVQLDGSCNGLQNFSAMLRDEVGGRATNLVPSEKPSDIYGVVAAEAQRAIDQEALEGDEKAQRWVGKMTRKLSKRNTMTLAYGVTKFGMRDQMIQEFKAMRSKGAKAEDLKIEDALYLADKNWDAVGNVVIAAKAAMSWLQKAASVVAKDGLPVRWVAPSGLLVQQDYRVVIGERIESYVTGQRIQLTLNVTGKEINKRKMASGISPNFVHSLDAAHLVGTVGLCLDNGVTSFSMIHDSFGAHAGAIDVLSQCLREAFVQQYSGDVLGDFRSQLVAALPEELAGDVPPIPAFGSLDISAVRNSDYFFA